MLMNRPDPMQPAPTEPQDDEEFEGAEEASPEDEEEMGRAQGALGKILYENEAGFNAVVKKLSNENVPAINRLSDTTVFLLTEIDKKINIDEGVILPFAAVVYDAVYEIAVTAKAFELPDDAVQKGLMVTLQVVLQAYGVSEEELNDYLESIGEQGASKLINFYKGVSQ